MNKNEFRKYGVKHLNVSGTLIDDYCKFQDNQYNLKNKLYQPNKNLTPMIIEERAMNITVISVFDRLMKDRIIWLFGPIDDGVATVIQAQLMFLDSVDNKLDITLHLDTPGGTCKGGLSIVDVMEYINSDITTVNTGWAASMGAVLLGAGTKGKRLSLRHSRTMIHQSGGGFQGSILDAEIDWEEWKKINEELFVLLGQYCGKTPKQIKKDAERDKWLTAKEAIAYGLIDGIITNKEKK